MTRIRSGPQLREPLHATEREALERLQISPTRRVLAAVRATGGPGPTSRAALGKPGSQGCSGQRAPPRSRSSPAPGDTPARRASRRRRFRISSSSVPAQGGPKSPFGDARRIGALPVRLNITISSDSLQHQPYDGPHPARNPAPHKIAAPAG